MNPEEIRRIEDNGLRDIRWKYWNLRHKAFLDEYRISDQELGQCWDKLKEEEEKGVSEYLRRKNANKEDSTNA